MPIPIFAIPYINNKIIQIHQRINSQTHLAINILYQILNIKNCLIVFNIWVDLNNRECGKGSLHLQ